MSNGDNGGAGGRRNNDVLWERVDRQDAAMRALAEETASQFRDFRAEVSSSISGVATSLGQQIASSNASIEKIATKLDASAAAVAESSKPRYNALFGGMIGAIGLTLTIVAGLSSLHDRPYDEKLTGLREAIGDLTKNTASGFGDIAKTTVSEREFQQTLEFRRQIQELTTSFRDQQLKATDAKIDTIAKAVVPRDEFVVRWAGEEKRDQAIESEITNINRRLDTLAPASDFLKNIGERQHELELKVYGEKH